MTSEDALEGPGSLLIVTGPPGAGKSTVAPMLAEALDPSVLIAGDNFFDFLATGAIEPWLPASAAQNQVVIEAAALATSRFVGAGYKSVFEGIVGPWFLETFLAAANIDTVDYVVLLPSADCCVARVKERLLATSQGKLSDDKATLKMHGEFIKAPVDDRHIIDNSDHTPETTFETITSRIAENSASYRCG